MSFDLSRMELSKGGFRQELRAKPIEEKLAMLDALRARALILSRARPEGQRNTLREGAGLRH